MSFCDVNIKNKFNKKYEKYNHNQLNYNSRLI